jgi:hypothetical protein
MNLKNYLQNRVRGWFPKEPTLPGKYTSNSPDDQKPKQPSKPSRFRCGIIFGLLFALLGIIYLFSRQYVLASAYFAGAIAIIVIAYLGKKFQIQIRPRIALGVLLIGMGVAILFYNDIAVVLFGSTAIFAPLFLSIGTLFTFWIVIGLVVGAIVLVWSNRKNGAAVNFLKRNLSKRRLLPYGAVAICIFLTYLAVISGIEFDYAIPMAFAISGFLVLKGLRRFAIHKSVT